MTTCTKNYNNECMERVWDKNQGEQRNLRQIDSFYEHTWKLRALIFMHMQVAGKSRLFTCSKVFYRQKKTPIIVYSVQCVHQCDIVISIDFAHCCCSPLHVIQQYALLSFCTIGPVHSFFLLDFSISPQTVVHIFLFRLFILSNAESAHSISSRACICFYVFIRSN